MNKSYQNLSSPKMKFVHFLSKTLGFQQNFIAPEPEADLKKNPYIS